MSIQFTDIVSRVQKIGDSLLLALPTVALGVVILVLFWGLAWVAKKIVRAAAARAGQPEGLQLVLARLVSWAVVILGVLIALAIVFPTITPASLLSTLGIGGVAIGFAFKDIFQNLLAGVLILLTRPFRIGDQIVSGEHEGQVEDIQVRATLVRTYDNRQIVIPNSELYTNRVTVNTAYPQRRLSVDVGIGYGDSIQHARTIILGVFHDLPGIVTDPKPAVLVTALADFAVLLEVRFWIDPPARRDAVEAQDQVLEAVKNALTEAGVDLPYPTQQLLLHNQTEGRDGDRAEQREGWPSDLT
ncbi:mechanosensitive ion channel family protein [Leucobacter komagatae]|uniref:Mechanosensitive ion channel protein MscS n=1 Tax=Leucobacter komagatae TaxID=55969 RepID=A0A0D0INY6_9MICO|nr:mechanosensitive ion channel family protein [Leucobacter komagatae]KIP51263.1 mechanosensitive ion channel protein MscS [Leucobacter komagatae]